ncbi:unnamed protein product [Cochlearia groenlandica]
MEELERTDTASSSYGRTVISEESPSIPLRRSPLIHPSPPPSVTRQALIPPPVSHEFVPPLMSYAHMMVDELLSQPRRESLQILDSGGTNGAHWFNVQSSVAKVSLAYGYPRAGQGRVLREGEVAVIEQRLRLEEGVESQGVPHRGTLLDQMGYLWLSLIHPSQRPFAGKRLKMVAPKRKGKTVGDGSVQVVPSASRTAPRRSTHDSENAELRTSLHYANQKIASLEINQQNVESILDIMAIGNPDIAALLRANRERRERELAGGARPSITVSQPTQFTTTGAITAQDGNGIEDLAFDYDMNVDLN